MPIFLFWGLPGMRVVKFGQGLSCCVGEWAHLGAGDGVRDE